MHIPLLLIHTYYRKKQERGVKLVRDTFGGMYYTEKAWAARWIVKSIMSVKRHKKRTKRSSEKESDKIANETINTKEEKYPERNSRNVQGHLVNLGVIEL